MKRLFVICMLISVALLYGAGTGEVSGARQNEVVVYAYDSFIAEWGPAPQLEKLFTEKTGYTVRFVSAGDAAQVLSRAVLEKKKPVADVLLGIDNNLLTRARDSGVLEPYKSPSASDIPSELVLAQDYILTSYDWSYFALIYDTHSSVPEPRSLEDLTKPDYHKRLILMDPRTSTPGLGFVAWTLAVYQNDFDDYWKRLKPSILTMAPGWDSGYGLFTAGEAPLVISYTTSAAYHLEYDGSSRYKALIFDQGHPVQIEGMGLVRDAPNSRGGKAFIDFMLSPEAQAVLPLTQWMYPVSPSVTLPSSYVAAPHASKKLFVDPASLAPATRKMLSILGN